jgi:TRAP-type uncharacterized transport system fused permease subunit
MEKKYYLGFALVGLILPYSQFIFFLLENGFDTSLIFQQIINYRISSYAWLDVIVTAIVVIIVILEEKERTSNWWLSIIATVIVGPSCGFPLFMYLCNY